MEHLCRDSLQEFQFTGNETFTESLQSLTDCTINFFQLVVNGIFIYSISLLLIYRVYCSHKCGTRNRFRNSRKGKRRRASKSVCSGNSDVFENNILFSGGIPERHSESEWTGVTVANNYDKADNYDVKVRLNILENFKDKSRQLFKHHAWIWILTFTLILITSAGLSEAIILYLTLFHYRDHPEPASINVTSTTPSTITVIHYLRLCTPLSSLLTLFCSLLLFQHSETTRTLKYLWIQLIYLFTSAAFAISYLCFYFYKLHLTFLHLKIIVNCASMLNASILIVLVFHTFLHESKVIKALAEKTLLNVKYLHYHTSLLSRLTFFWFTLILKIGYRTPLEENDLGSLPPEEKAQFQFERFNEKYEAEKDKCESSVPKREFSLWKCLFATLGSSLAISGMFRLLADLTGFVAPLGIRTIVKYVGRNSSSSDELLFVEHMESSDVFSNGYVMACVILLSAILQSTFSQCSTFLVNSEGIHIKVALQALIYKKSLTLSPTKTSTSQENIKSESSSQHDDGSSSQSSGFDTGSIINILSEDTNNIMMFFWMANYIWAIPLKLAILMGLLYLQLGFSALIGAGVCILIMIPLQFYLGKKMSCNSKELMEKCDERLRSTSEILQGMKLLKLQGWELLFGQQIIAIREKELKNLDRDLLYRSIMTFLTHISSVLVTVVTFGLYSYIETEKLDPSKVFAGLALFNQLTVPLFIFPITVPVVIDALVSTKRVREFLLMPEAISYTKEDEETNDSETNYSDKQQNVMGNIKTLVSSATLLNKKPTLKIPKISDVDASTDSVFAPIAEANEEEDDDDDDDDIIDDADNDLVLNSEDELLDKDVTPIMTTNKVSIQSQPKVYDKSADDRIPGIDSTDSFDSDAKKLDSDTSHELDSIMTLTDGEFSWEDDQHDQTLSGMNVKIPNNKLTVIVGPIGSGKSSFISAILGEMRKVGGEVQWKRDSKIAYAAQKPWILNATVKENILFGKSFKIRRYKRVIAACSLQTDIDSLPSRENTEIGDKGINLSGGQRQRIAIARALYSNSDVVILDDPLSALDTEVAQNVFKTGIRQFLLHQTSKTVTADDKGNQTQVKGNKSELKRNKGDHKSNRTVILVTHHLPALEFADQIIAMEKGRIRATGTYKEIETSNPKLHEDWKSTMEREAMRKKSKKTGAQSWKLVRNVTKVGMMAKSTMRSNSMMTEEEKKMEGYKKRKETYSAHKALSHEYRAGDECYYEDLMYPILCHRTVSKQAKEARTSTSSVTKSRPQLSRMTSLQVEMKGHQSSPILAKKVQRLQSLPAEDEPLPSSLLAGGGIIRARSGTNESTMSGFNARLKRKFFSKNKVSSTGSSITEMDKITGSTSQRLTSTVSGETEELPEDVSDEETLLMSREYSQDEREYGLIPIRVYLTYIAACGHFLSSFYIFVAIGYEVVHVYTNFWLKEWSDEVGRSPDYQYDDVMSHYFTVYVLLSIVTVLVSLTTNIIGKQAGANSREKLHSQMFNCIIRCPVKFFDSTPIGRVINRFASDVAVVDRKLCVSMQRFLQFVFLCISAIVVNAIVNPWFLIVAIPIVIIYYGLQRFYRFSSRELHRIEAISRGPIFSHFHETLEGLSTIRAFGVQRRFTNQMLATIDVNNTAAIFINSGNRWLSISLDYLGSVIVFLATFVSMISSYLHPDVVTPSMVGLAINYTLLVPVYLNHVVKFLAEVEMFMNSVDRIDRFSKLETENYGDENSANLPENWPPNGEVWFDDVSVRYNSSGTNIITNVKARIPPRQKVGICGRSGSGKSSLLMALFRIPEICHGKIEIDGIDVNNIPLLQLRSGIAIIPQENILFSGTIRFNLDPQHKINDTDIWQALELCQMKQTIQDLPGQLDAEIKDGGSAFSAGQKQLLGLARVILRKTKLIIMDEATSSVDSTTETTLLRVVNDVFKDSTVLTIAHRLGTITDGDRVLVLDAGCLVEDGPTKDLMARPTGIFAEMLKSSDK